MAGGRDQHKFIPSLINGHSWYFEIKAQYLSKCHAIIVSNLNCSEIIVIKIGSHDIPTQLTTNYHGIHIDSKLTFSQHLTYVNNLLS